MILMVAISVPLGLFAGSRAGRRSDGFLRLFAISGSAVPVFWLGIMLQILFFSRLGWLPAAGRLDITAVAPPRITGLLTVDSLLAGDLTTFVDAVEHLALPAITLASGGITLIALVTRASVVDVVDADYVRTAHAKGLPRSLVLRRHVLKNALIPSVTLLGLELGYLLGGSALVEMVFAWPGIGRYAVSAIRNLDYAPVMGVTLIMSMIYVLANLAVDLIYPLIDPRISLRRSALG
jgi:peptide/nickel transport system permease protein